MATPHMELDGLLTSDEGNTVLSECETETNSKLYFNMESILLYSEPFICNF
jgi:hypothetical protein